MSQTGQTRLPLLALRHAALKLHDRSAKSMQAWARQKPSSILEKNRDRGRCYMLAIGEVFQRHSGQQCPVLEIASRHPAFFAHYPGVQQQYDRVVEAFYKIMAGPEITSWAKKTRVNLADPKIIQRLVSSFGRHIINIAWDKSFYPDALMKGKKAAKDWPDMAVQLTDRMIKRLETDQALIFVQIFPRRSPSQLPPSLRTLTY